MTILYKIYQSRNILQALARREVLSRYSGTMLRGLWEFANPAITILLYWFIFSVVFNAKGPNGTPFIIYFISGYVPWIFFSETLTRGTQGVVAHTFLIKKMVFDSELLPFVYLVGGAFNHLLLMSLVLVVLYFNGVTISLYFIQIAYFFLILCLLLVSLQWLLSAINVFNRDLGQGLIITLNIWFWITPIVWVADNVIPEKYLWLINLNPLSYVVQGYRNTLLYQQPFWIGWESGLFVWGLLIPITFINAIIFRKLKPHFGDVL